MKSFIESQSRYCSLNDCFIVEDSIIINRIHERALRITYNDTSSYRELLTKDRYVKIHHRNIRALGNRNLYRDRDMAPNLFHP